MLHKFFFVLESFFLNFLKNEKAERQGIMAKRLKCAYNQEYLFRAINLKVRVSPVFNFIAYNNFWTKFNMTNKII